jgi:hypothetical protein
LFEKRILATEPMFRGLLLSLVALPLGALAQSPTPDPSSLRAVDAHENMTISADPYTNPERYKGVFGKKSPYDAGILAVRVYFRNDNTSALRINASTIRLVVSPPGGQRQRLGPLTPEEVADRTLLTANPKAARRPFPIPGAAAAPRNKDWTQMVDLLRTVVLGTAVLPPHATTHGIFFFDVNHDFDAVRDSQLYVPDLIYMTDHKALFYFEVDLGEALTNVHTEPR